MLKEKPKQNDYNTAIPNQISIMEITASDFAKSLASRFDVVCFDLDQCAVQCHSRGRLPRENLDDFASKISPDFVLAVPALLECNIKLAIVTHSDLAQHGDLKPRRGPGAIVLGDELVHEVLLRAVPEYAHEFFVVGWRPKSRGSEGTKDPGKLRHMRACAAFYDVPIERCVLFDDDATNCTLTKGKDGSFSAYKCDPEKGFRLTDYHERANDNYFGKRSDGSIDRLGRWEAKWNHEYKSKPRFHLPIPNPNLVKFHSNEFNPPKNNPILLPLCGKTIDLQWLSTAGHQCVVGIEGVEKSIQELKDELLHDLRHRSNDSDNVWTTAPEDQKWFQPSISASSEDDSCISIVCSDFFELSPSTFGVESPCFGAVYDRAALVAVPPHSRPQYVDVIDSLLIPGGQILMVTVDSGRDTGPPFPVTPGVVEELFSTRDYSTQLLEESDADFGEGSKEYVFLLTKAL